MPHQSRRAFLRGAGIVVAGGLAGCTSRLPVIGRTETPDDWPERETALEKPARWRLTHEYGAGAPVIGSDTACLVWGASGEADGPMVSMIEPQTGAVESHRKVSHSLVRGPIAHEGNFYLYTGRIAGRRGEKLQLRKFAPDGTEQWTTDRRDGRINFLDVGGGRAYLGTSSEHYPSDSEFPLYAVPLDEGTWTQLGTSGGTSSGYYHDEQLLLNVGTRSVASHDPVDGTEQWRVDGRTLTDAHRRPALTGDVAYVERRSGVTAIDRRNGSTVWTFPLAEDATAAEGAVVAGDTLVVSRYADNVLGLDRGDGTERWRIETDGTNSRPLLADGMALVSDEAALHAIDPATGEHRWQTDSARTVGDYGRGMVVAVSDGESSDEIVALNVEDGTERWRYEAPDVGGITVGESHTYASVEGELVALG